MSAEFSMNIERAIDRLNETTCNVSFSGYNWNNTMELLVQIEFRTEKKHRTLYFRVWIFCHDVNMPILRDWKFRYDCACLL